MITVTFKKSFEKGFKSLPPHRARGAKDAIKQFMVDASHPSLCFRSLKGTSEHHIIDATGGDRIILRKITEQEYEAVDVGPHDNVYRRWDR